MRPFLVSNLHRQFPFVFREQDQDLPGDGWYDIIYNLARKIEDIIMPLPDVDDYYAIQVKEKFGGLRFYMSAYHPDIEAAILEAEKESFVTCETCGAPGKLTGSAWFVTACKLHANK